MNRQPYRKPPRWWSPIPSPFWMRVWQPFRRYQQVKWERVLSIRVEGVERIHQAMQRGLGVLITPNHPGHADCYLLWEALTRLKRPCYVMTAWQVFGMAKPMDRFIWRQHGCFSVNREGTDLQAFKQAVQVLAASSHPLVVFPEGDVYHLNDRVTTFRDGTAAIAASAAKRSNRPVACFPCALKYEYIRDPTPELQQVMARLEQKVNISVQNDLPLPDRIYRFAEAMLAQREQQFLGKAASGSLEARVPALADAILQRHENAYNLRPGESTVPERVKALRQEIIDRQLALAEDDSRQMTLARQMEDLFVATQLYSYPGDYVRERPTIERIAETIDKFEEDILNAPTAGVRGARRGVVMFGEPVLVTQKGNRAALEQVTQTLQQRVQGLLDQVNGLETVRSRTA